MLLNKKLIGFLVAGFTASVVNIVLMLFFVEILHFSSHLLKNIANFLSIALSVVYNFIVCRSWAWNDLPKKYGKDLLLQITMFAAANAVTTFVRVILFAILDKSNINYLANVVIGIAAAASISFFLYDKIVFKIKLNNNHAKLFN